MEVVVASAIHRRVEKFSDRRMTDGNELWREREIALRCTVAALANEIAKGFEAENPRVFDPAKFAAVCGLYISHGGDNYSNCLPGQITWENPAGEVTP